MSCKLSCRTAEDCDRSCMEPVKPAELKPTDTSKFCQVSNYAEMLAEQARHTEKLQAKLQPMSDRQIAQLADSAEAALWRSFDKDPKAALAMAIRGLRTLMADNADPQLRLRTYYCCEKAVGTGKLICEDCENSGQANSNSAHDA